MASTTLTHLDWENSKLIDGDVPGGIRALKEEDGPELQVHGSANLIQTLLEHGLVDEFRIWTFPVVLGRGKRLFDGGTLPDGLELAESQVSSTGVVHRDLPPGAGIKSGSFAARRRARPSWRAAPRRRTEAGPSVRDHGWTHAQ